MNGHRLSSGDGAHEDRGAGASSSLQDLRKAIAKTQTAIARQLKVGQGAVSKLETRSDMYISTLRSLLKAMGGELELIARFPDRPPIRLKELGAASSRRKRDRRAAA